MKPHFYSLSSRLGMINIPHRQNALNIGVEDGGDAILDSAFLQKFPESSLDKYEFPKPEAVDKGRYFQELSVFLEEAKRVILGAQKSDEIQVVIGGDHSVSFSALTALFEQYKGEDIAYIQVDSHPDMNKISTSPTGNFHGMWMRPFVDGFESPEINKLITYKFKPEQLLFVGNLDLDPEEQRFFKEKSIRKISVDDIRERAGETSEEISEFLRKFKHVHIDIDIDGFDQSIAPATGIPAKSGLLMKDVADLFAQVKKAPSYSVDLVEVNPKKDGAKQTIGLAKDILFSLLQ